jgi:predicted Zn-ribbon and HTH transcriptional regulator
MEVLRTAILEMCRQKKNDPFCTSDVVKRMFPEDWEEFLEEVKSVAMELNREGSILILQNEKPIDPESQPIGQIWISRIPNQSRR